ncbi:MAG: hypothetical protein JWQ09_3687, partial [Segetibacter sp.]|nr:hypothetical protein [Segetibacter sp.]
MMLDRYKLIAGRNFTTFEFLTQVAAPLLQMLK